MKTAAFILIITSLFCLNSFAADTGQTPAAQNPSVTQIVGNASDAKLGPGLYPRFADFLTTNDKKCEKYLSKDYSEGGFSLAPICTKSKYGNGHVGGECHTEFVPIDELVFKNFKIDPAYRKTAKLLITWTVRIEGYAKRHSITPQLCLNWYGTASEQFPRGQVKTALYVNGRKTGAEVALEIPETTEILISEQPPRPRDLNGGPAGAGDPVLVGTYVLTASDFLNGNFPESIDLIEIRWKNDTAMKIVSPKGMRNMIINMLPMTKEK